MVDSRFNHAKPAGPELGRRPTGPDLDDGLLEACRGAVSRVLSELPARNRQIVEGRRAEMVAATHRETRAAIEEIVGAMREVA